MRAAGRVLVVVAAIGCGRGPATPAPAPVGWTVAAAPGVRFDAVRVTCPGRASGEQDVDETAALEVGPGCAAVGELGGRRVPLRLPAGTPGRVRCDADGACVR